MHENTLVYTKFNSVNTMFRFSEGKAFEYIEEEPDDMILLDDIIVGVVDSVKESINACFIKISPEDTGFLSLEDVDQRFSFGKNKEKLVPGDLILCQVKSLPQKNKGYRLSMHLTLKGRFTVINSVFSNNELNKLTFSSKLSKERIEELEKLQFNLQDLSCILRTACETGSDDEIVKEFDALSDILINILKNGDKRTPYSRLYKGRKTLYNRLLSLNPDKIVTDDRDIYDYLKKDSFISDKLSFYDDKKLNLNVLYKLKEAHDEAFARKVNLSNGGFLIIDKTEALTVIDVNSGKGSAAKNSIIKTNTEACFEIRRQLSLRNLSGIIIVDFINMDSSSEKETVSLLKKLFRDDSVKTNCVGFTKLGLCEITREKTYAGL